MTKEEIMKVLEMRVDGRTYQSIADETGYTKQHIQQVVKAVTGDKEHKFSTKAVYPNLYRELKIKYKSVSAFCKNEGFTPKRAYDILEGKTRVTLDEACYFAELLKRDISYLFCKKEGARE